MGLFQHYPLLLTYTLKDYLMMNTVMILVVLLVDLMGMLCIRIDQEMSRCFLDKINRPMMICYLYDYCRYQHCKGHNQF